MSTGTPRLAADLERFRDRLEDAAALGAHVRRVDAAVLARHLAHRDQRVGVDPDARRSAERARNPERALLHGFAHQSRICRQLGRGRRTGLRSRARRSRSRSSRRTCRCSSRCPASAAARSIRRSRSMRDSPRALLATDGAADPPSPKIIDVTPCRIMLSALPSVSDSVVGVVVDVDESGRDDEAGRIDDARPDGRRGRRPRRCGRHGCRRLPCATDCPSRRQAFPRVSEHREADPIRQTQTAAIPATTASCYSTWTAIRFVS